MLRRRLLKYSLQLVLVLFAAKGQAQVDNVDFQTWTDFTYTHTIKNKIGIGADAGVRGLVSEREWNQFYIRPDVKYYFNRIVQVTASVALFGTESNILKNTFEFRTAQQVSVAWPTFEAIHFYHRVRFEQRFFYYQDDLANGVDIPNDFELRGRYQISFETLDIRLGNTNNAVYFLAGWELFTALNEGAIESFVNNQRLLGGLGHRINPKFKYELQYIYQKSRILTDEGLKASEHILRLRIFLLSRSPKQEN